MIVYSCFILSSCVSLVQLFTKFLLFTWLGSFYYFIALALLNWIPYNKNSKPWTLNKLIYNFVATHICIITFYTLKIICYYIVFNIQIKAKVLDWRILWFLINLWILLLRNLFLFAASKHTWFVSINKNHLVHWYFNYKPLLLISFVYDLPAKLCSDKPSAYYL